MDKKVRNNNFFERLQFFGLGKERDYFLESLSALLASGMPITDAITGVREEIQSRRLRKIVDALADDIQAGFSLAEAIERSNLFSGHISSLIRIGERSGRLVENLKIIATEQEKDRVLKSKLRSATMYPVFVLGLTAVVGTGIAWFILPKLALVFSQLNLELPVVTQFLIAGGLFLNDHGSYVVPLGIVALVILFYFLFSFPKTRAIGESILLCIPGIKTLMKETELARFGYLLGTLLSAGLSPNESLTSLAEATTLSRYRKFYHHMANQISEGNSFKKSFASYPGVHRLFPASVQQLVFAGERSGSLSESLIKIGRYYESKTDTTAKDLSVILEPILLVIVWLGVVAVALAVILPIYSLIGGLNPR